MKMTKTPNQSIMPLTAKTNEHGHLEIGGCDCVELAKKHGTALYVYDETTIRQICKDYKNAFSSYPKMSMMFASKAFMTKAICKIMQQEGFGLDVVSKGEIYTAKQAGFDLKNTVFNGSNKTIDELELALEYGVGRFSVDNFLEMKMLNNLAKEKNQVVDILLRITPGIECHTHEYIKTGLLDSKFGFDLNKLDSAIELIRNEYKNLNLMGFHAHIGSQIFETDVYYDLVNVILAEFKRVKDKYGVELTEMNIGGGLGISYTEHDDPPSIFEIAETIIKSLNENTQKYGLEKPSVIIEPGRSIIGTSGVTLYTVGSTKEIPELNKKYVAVDGGMADNPRPSMYGAEYHAVVATKMNDDNLEKITLAGRFCESGDILIKDIELPKTQAGDIIAIFNTGAYGYSMSSNYNRALRAGAVIVQNGESDVIIKREGLEHLVSLDVVPDRLQ